MKYMQWFALLIIEGFWMQDFRKSQEPFVDKLKEPVLDEITSALTGRYRLNFTRQETSSLWFLCKQVFLSHVSV